MTQPTHKDMDGKAGVRPWRLEGTPRETETIRLLYGVRYPSDKERTDPGQPTHYRLNSC